MKLQSIITTALFLLIIQAVSVFAPLHTLAADINSSDTQANDTYVKKRPPSAQEILTGRQNIVLRARQVNEIEWTPLRNVIRWNNRGVFKAGETVKGLPYGFPPEANYVPIRTSFSEFLEEVNNKNSQFYTKVATRHADAPYFSLDCSAFVSWAWGLEERLMTGSLYTVSENLGTDMKQIQVGDALNKPRVHVVLVTYIKRNNGGEISSIGIMELYYPKSRYTVYGEEGDLPLIEVSRRYLNNGYSIIRYNDVANVVYLHDCAVPLDFDYCTLCIGDNVKLNKNDKFRNGYLLY